MTIIHDIFPFPFINALGWTLLHSIWQIMIIGCILVLVRMVLANLSPHIKYRISVLAMILIVFFSVVTFFTYYQSQDYFAIPEKNAGNDEQIIPLYSAEIIAGKASAVPEQHISIMIKAFLQEHLGSLVFIWFIGIVLLSVKVGGGYFNAQRIKVRKTRNIPEELNSKITGLCAELGLKKQVNVLQSKAVILPAVIGYLKPAIILPAAMITGMPANQLESIIIHELAHIVRKDHLVNLIQSFVEIIYFYHPLIWWISNTIRLDREQSCDDMVVQLSDNSLDYAKALSELAGYSISTSNSVVGLTGKKNHLLKRIKRITNQPLMRENFSSGLLSLLLIIITVFSVSFSREAGSPAHDVEGSTFFNFDFSNEWWYPIIKKHKIELRAFSNYRHVLETGSRISMYDDRTEIEDAVIIFNAGLDYLIVTAPQAVFVPEDSTFNFKQALVKRFLKTDPKPFVKEQTACGQLQIQLRNDFNGAPSFYITNLKKQAGAGNNGKWMPRKTSKPESLITGSYKAQFGSPNLLSGEFQAGTWEIGDTLSQGTEISFKMWHGVELQTDQMQFNGKTEEFETRLLKFIVLKNKVIINYLDNAQGDSDFNANEIYRENNLIRLLGNAVFTTNHTVIKAREIIFDQTR